jgi:hypothetical protein
MRDASRGAPFGAPASRRVAPPGWERRRALSERVAAQRVARVCSPPGPASNAGKSPSERPANGVSFFVVSFFLDKQDNEVSAKGNLQVGRSQKVTGCRPHRLRNQPARSATHCRSRYGCPMDVTEVDHGSAKSLLSSLWQREERPRCGIGKVLPSDRTTTGLDGATTLPSTSPGLSSASTGRTVPPASPPSHCPADHRPPRSVATDAHRAKDGS